MKEEYLKLGLKLPYFVIFWLAYKKPRLKQPRIFSKQKKVRAKLKILKSGT